MIARLTLLAVGAVAAIAATGQNPEPKKPVEPLKVAPRAYFVAHCQRCHGVDGINFVPGFADANPAKLEADIVRMADGPGGASLKPEDVKVQIAYHKLMSAERPFIAWTERKGKVLKGEVSDGAKLTTNVGKLAVDDDFVWTLTLESEADLAKVKLTAAIGKRTIELAPSVAAYSELPKPANAGTPLPSGEEGSRSLR